MGESSTSEPGQIDLSRPWQCFIDECRKPATLIVESYPDNEFLCDEHRSLYTPAPWDRVVKS